MGNTYPTVDKKLSILHNNFYIIYITIIFTPR